MLSKRDKAIQKVLQQRIKIQDSTKWKNGIESQRMFAMLRYSEVTNEMVTKEILLCNTHSEAISNYWDIIKNQENKTEVPDYKKWKLFHIGYYLTDMLEVEEYHVFDTPVKVEINQDSTIKRDKQELKKLLGKLIKVENGREIDISNSSKEISEDTTPYLITYILQHEEELHHAKMLDTEQDIMEYLDSSELFQKPSMLKTVNH